MKDLVYIMGKVTGEDYYACWNKFQEREDELRKLDLMPINPMRMVSKDIDWVSAVKFLIPLMLQCKYVSPLPCTWGSREAIIEFNLSQELKMPIIIPEPNGTTEPI
jgi:hypothetical protein